MKKIEVIFCISSTWDKIRLHNENQLPWLPGSALKVSVMGWSGGCVDGGGGVFHSIMGSHKIRFWVEVGL